ncbi:MAG: NAD(P)/FAD-dependent oxidoreductase [Gammaproteobacteria bacterium]
MKSDLVIIGGGIIGLYSAYLLAQRGVNITLIDRNDFGQESSWVAGGILAPLLPWDYNNTVLALTNNASNNYHRLSTHLEDSSNSDIGYWQSGLTVLEEFTDEIKHWCLNHNLTCHPTQHYSSNDFHLPEIAQVRMPMVIKALIAYLKQNNVTLLSNTEVNSYLIENSKIVAVKSSAGDIYTDHILLATGAWLPEIARYNQSIRAPSILPIKGQVIAVQTVPGLLNHILYKDGHYLIPRKDGLILAGSTLEDIGYDKKLTSSARNSLWQKSMAILPQLGDYTITHQWAGLRPSSPNSIPTIGPHPDIEGLYLNCGHFRYGVAMAPKSAQIITEWILNTGNSLTDEERAYATANFS